MDSDQLAQADLDLHCFQKVSKIARVNVRISLGFKYYTYSC